MSPQPRSPPYESVLIQKINWGVDETESPSSENNFYNFTTNHENMGLIAIWEDLHWIYDHISYTVPNFEKLFSFYSIFHTGNKTHVPYSSNSSSFAQKLRRKSVVWKLLPNWDELLFLSWRSTRATQVHSDTHESMPTLLRKKPMFSIFFPKDAPIS